jgi:succinoglycan biosynthesis protein ExoA
MPPFVTVVLPVRNEGAFIRRSLGSVLAQDYPDSLLEVIVADGMSSDGTREEVRQLQKVHPNLQLIDNLGKIVPTGLNAAIAQARGDIIVRVDGHCEIAPDYVRRCVANLETAGVEAVGGPLITVGETPLAEVIATAMSTSFGVGDSAFRTTSNRTVLTDTVAFPAYTRAILERAGPFDEELVRNQDDEFNYRLRRLGARVLLASDVTARYYSRASLGRLWRQYFQYGYWKVRVMQKHPLQMRPRQFVPPLFVTALSSALILAPFSSAAQIAACVVAGSYSAANLGCSCFVAHRRGWRLLPRLPVVFAILHIAYGAGFLAGLVTFRNRWREGGKDVPRPATTRDSIRSTEL